ncbi:MAG: TolC family protein [Acidobacteria bacterium]|nr:MAG: TolC family protein [Acidobacteriota bacterium]
MTWYGKEWASDEISRLRTTGVCRRGAQRGRRAGPGRARKRIRDDRPRAPAGETSADPRCSARLGLPEGNIALSLSEAIERGLSRNLGSLLADAGRQAAAGERLRLRSELLPEMSVRTGAISQQINLAAFGFRGFPGTPPVVGPFGVFDARVSLSAPLLDLRALRNIRAGGENSKAADLTYQDARDTVVLAVGGLYLQALAAESRVKAAGAQLETAEALYNQAVDMKSSGLVPAIEVLRLQVERQVARQRRIAAENDFEKHAIGLQAAQRFHLTDPIRYTPLAPVSPEALIEEAAGARADYQAGLARLRAAEARVAAARAERLPSLSLDANYGTIGRRPDESHGTYSVAATVTIPLFQGGRVRGNVLEAEAALRERRSEVDDLRNRIALEIRTALLDVKASSELVEATSEAVKLASEQLEHARDRFAAGVASNLEVVQAQESVAAADDNYIASLFSYNWAKGVLGRAVGGAEKTYRRYWPGTNR